VLRNALAEVAGIERAFIYGSWAARHAQRSGPVRADIDLLVIGRPDRRELDDAVAGAESVIGARSTYAASLRRPGTRTTVPSSAQCSHVRSST
jgi:hypothetical protein